MTGNDAPASGPSRAILGPEIRKSPVAPPGLKGSCTAPFTEAWVSYFERISRLSCISEVTCALDGTPPANRATTGSPANLPRASATIFVVSAFPAPRSVAKVGSKSARKPAKETCARPSRTLSPPIRGREAEAKRRVFLTVPGFDRANCRML